MTPSAGISSTTRSEASVSVPVLSVHITDTEARLSIAFSCWARIPCRAIFAAVTAAVRLTSRISPSGTMLTIPAVSVSTASDWLTLRSASETPRPIPSGAMKPTITIRSRSIARSSGERGWRKARAVSVSRAAWLSAPTAVASKSPSPSTAKEPERTSSPTRRATGSDSPVSSDSSSASPSARTRSPSAAIWSPLAIRTRSPTTTSPTGTARGVPSRTTVAFATTSAASLSSVRLARTSWKVPIATLATRMPRKSASFGLPQMIVAAPKPARIALKTVKVLATAIER